MIASAILPSSTPRSRHARNVEVFLAPERLDAVIGVRRHLAIAEKIMFHAELCRCHGPLFLPVMIFHDNSRSSFPARSRFTSPCNVTRRSGRLSMNLRKLGSDQRM